MAKKMSTLEAAAALKIGKHAVRALIKRGRLPAKLVQPLLGVKYYEIDPKDVANFEYQKAGWRKGKPRKLKESCS